VRLARPRHPRFLARVPPTRLAWWSFLMATAHGAGLMLVPIALGLCAAEATQHGHVPIGTGIGIALLMALVHTVVMIACGLALAWVVYRWLGLGFLSRGWLNLETVWALSLVATGLVATGMAWTEAG
jgi:cation transporter-like permease